MRAREKRTSEVVPEPGLEPGRRQRRQGILSPRRLPVPPLRHACSICRGDGIQAREGATEVRHARGSVASEEPWRPRGGSATRSRGAVGQAAGPKAPVMKSQAARVKSGTVMA